MACGRDFPYIVCGGTCHDNKWKEFKSLLKSWKNYDFFLSKEVGVFTKRNANNFPFQSSSFNLSHSSHDTWTPISQKSENLMHQKANYSSSSFTLIYEYFYYNFGWLAFISLYTLSFLHYYYLLIFFSEYEIPLYILCFFLFNIINHPIYILCLNI